MPISDEELRRRTLVASGRYDELARLLQSVKLRKLLVSCRRSGVEDATLDSTGLETLNEFDISAKQPGERILLLEALRARLASKGSDGRKRGTVITACKGYCFVRADGQPKKKGKDGYYCSFKDVEGRKTLVKGDRVAFEVVSCNPGSKHSFKLQNVVVISDDGTLLGRLGLGHLAPVLAREQIDEDTRCSASRIWSRPIQRPRRRIVAAAAPPCPPKNGEHERTLAEAKGAVLRLMEENKRLREESSAGLVKENRRLRQELAESEKSRKEEIAAKAAEAYQSERAANRCALEGLELMKRNGKRRASARRGETGARRDESRTPRPRREGADPRHVLRDGARGRRANRRRSGRRTKRRGSS